jgi:hypothetical protein
MKHNFKPGDKVVVYDGLRYTGFVTDIDESQVEESILVVKDTNPTYQRWVHPKQLRRIRKRAKAREWTLTHDIFEFNKTIDGPVLKEGEVVRVREVRRKSK